MTDHVRKEAPRRGSYAARLEAFLDSLTPTSLDDIVRENRDRVEIGLATAEELASRAAKIAPGRPAGTIDQWRPVAFRARLPPSCVARGTVDAFRFPPFVDVPSTAL